MFGWCGFVGGGTAGLKAKMGRWQSLIGREWHGRSGSYLGHWSSVEWTSECLDWLLVALWVAVASRSRVYGSQYIGWQVPLICRTGAERRSVGWMGWLGFGLVWSGCGWECCCSLVAGCLVQGDCHCVGGLGDPGSAGWIGLVLPVSCDVGFVDGRWALLPTLGRLAGGLRECSARTIRDFWVGWRSHVRFFDFRFLFGSASSLEGVCWGFTLCVG
ncbi:hypothetical protein B0H11DRAFT_1997494 [Mycena galericulata]|nr:hypothetical protein B0H11DRAFT_1997494 [Mycena galericulata]